MKKVRGLKAILASFLVTVALAAPAAVLSSGTPEVEAELHFSGVSLEMLPDGTIQAIFEVSVDKVINCAGASFVLDYNPDYFTPSYINGATHKRNEIFTSSTPTDDDGFFAYDPTLYKVDVSPFSTMKVSDGAFEDEQYYSTVVIDSHTISMDLWLDQDTIRANGAAGKVKALSDGGFDNSIRFVFNRKDELLDEDKDAVAQRVTLGRLSFQVKPERLEEIARYFPKPENGDPVTPVEIAVVRMDNGEDTYLIRTAEDKLMLQGAEDSWMIGYYKSDHPDSEPKFLHHYRAEIHKDVAKRYYELAVDPKQLMKVRPAEKEVTINAYQAFTDGTWGDVAQALRRYSPMATVTYVNGTQENIVIPWGEIGDEYKGYEYEGDEYEGYEYEYTVTVKGADGEFHPVDLTDNSTYNPLEGVYKITQYVPGKSTHLIPITVTLTVTPIKLLDVQVENKVLTYDLADVVLTVQSPSDLHLPEKARLITDIVPSGVSMVMRIPGWKPEKGSWPIATDSNASILMNDLKEDSFGTSDAPSGEEGFDGGTMPYWPDDEDMGAISRHEYHKFLKQKKNGVELGHWIGEYTFHIADQPGGTVKVVEVTGASGPETIEGFTREEIQKAFPWLTVEKEGYAVPSALRQIVTTDSLTNADSYKAGYVSTEVASNNQPELTLSVRRTDGAELAEGSIFRVWLPNGLELGTGQNISTWPDYSTTNTDDNTVKDWFPKTVVDDKTVQNGNYHTQKIDEVGNNRFHLVTNPGDPTTGGEETFPDNRETLRRYINLGGWYQVAVCEEPGSRTWSDPMPVYVPPRPNEYQSDKEYNFVGENTELFHWPGGLTHYVTMPQGTYTAVTKDGARLYNVNGEILTVAEIQAKAAAQAGDPNATPRYGNYLDDKGRPKTTTLRYEASYGYHTTYDGSTGAQPGTLYSFQVGPVPDPVPAPGAVRNTPWPSVKEPFSHDVSAIPVGENIYRYGSDPDPATLDPFYDGAVYASFGTVTQPANTRPVGDQPATAEPYKVTVRRDWVEDIKSEREHITLTSDSPTGITRVDNSDIDSRVVLATYDTRKAGYTDRQEYTFTLTNDGDVPIYGLAIDGLTDGYVDDPTGGRFEMIQPPASFLAPGQSTTFVLTYVYNLAANKPPNPDTYRDTLYVTSSSHPTAKKGGTNQENKGADGSYDYLLDFDAQFYVSDKDTHTVTVVVNPSDLSMGNAGLIVGKQSNTMNYTVTTRSYPEGEKVFVAVYMKDEYELVQTPTWRNSAGTEIPLTYFTSEDNGNIPLQPGIEIYTFDMPDYDTVVTVDFKEGILSKLRLSDLIDFSADKEEKLKPGTDPVAEENTYRVWRKSYTDDEKKYAKEQWHDVKAQSPEEDLYLTTVGTTVPKDKGGNQFISTENQYIVVIPHDADWSQVQVKLRELQTHSDYTGVYDSDEDIKYNEDIYPTVDMDHYDWGFEKAWTASTPVDDEALDVVEPKGNTNDPSVHYSETFRSPAPGTSDYVRITVSYGTERRRYYLEIHRAPEDPIATLHYGNSPYGMIMNDSSFHRSTPEATKDAQDDAKAFFRNNGYTFYTTSPIKLNVPHVVRDGRVSEEAVYWREAWVHNTQLFEPESLTGFKVTYPSPTPTPTPDPSASPSPAPDANRREPVISPDPSVYKDEENLDLNDDAYFAILGENMMEPGIVEALDSTGRPVKLEDIHVRATVTLLDNDATTQIGRFSGTKTAVLDLNTLKDTGRGKILLWSLEPAKVGDATEKNWNVSSEVDPDTGEKTYTQVEHIRPGQYVMEYTYDDYNGEPLKVTRPFVILSSVGDVNCDGGAVNTNDETVLKNRVADPLGYVAGRWEWVQVKTSPEKWEWKETVYERSNIFKYRVVDVNNDRNVNNIDGNLIDKIARSKAQAIRFYNPLYYIYSASGT